MVVDDEPMVRDSIKMLLQHFGCIVSTVGDGEAALAEMHRRSFDVVLTDFSMPGMPGDKLVAHIRELWPAQRVIMVTAYVEEYKVFGNPAHSVDALVLKPFSLKDLLDAIESVLEEPKFDLPPKTEAGPAIEARPATKNGSHQGGGGGKPKGE